MNSGFLLPKPAETAIEIRGVHKTYGKVAALLGVDLIVRKGEIFGLLGPNGAGKTTLIKILTTLLRPDKGAVLVAGADPVADPKFVREKIGLAGQYAAVDEILTGFENLMLAGRLYHLPRKTASERARELLSIFELTDAAGRPLKTYSGGMRRRLDLAASLMGEPLILFLDEPTTGLDPHSRAELWKMLKDLKGRGTTILLTTQYLEEADYLADRVAVMDHGKIIAEDTPRKLKEKLGRGMLELHVVEKSTTEVVALLMNRISKERPHFDAVTGRITIPVEDPTRAIVDAVRLLDGAKIGIEDIYLRKPTLDEVFIELTERPPVERELN